MSFLKTSLFVALLSPMVLTSCVKTTTVKNTDEDSDNVEINLGVRSGVNSTAQTSRTPEITLLAWTVNGGEPVTLRPLLRFSQLPTNGGEKPPTKAFLTLYSHPKPSNGDKVKANSGTDNSFTIRRVTSSWDPTTIPTWGGQPTTTTVGQVIVAHTSESRKDLLSIDVTQIVKDIYANGNNGIMLQLRDETYYTSRIFCSSTHADASLRPKLTLVW